MKKTLILFGLAAIFGFNTATASASEVARLSKGECLFEIGTSPNAKVTGKIKGTDAEAEGKSGFKTTFTYAIDDDWEFQYRKTMFDSKEASISLFGRTLSSTSSVDLNDYNFRYRLNDRHKLVFGLENSRINYDKYVKPASHTTFHIGFDSEYPLSSKATAFTKHVWGNHTSDQEYGVLFDVSKRETVSVSYIHRKSRLPVSLYTDQLGLPPAMGAELPLGSTDYKMTGISLMYGVKL